MNGNISAWSIRQPVPSLVLFLVLLVLGVMSFKQLPITRFPNIDVPIVQVRIYQAGTAPAELETQVTKKVEDAVASVNGLKHIDILRMFNDDPETDAVIMVGEIGGSDEETAAEWVKANMKKPVVGFIAGVTAPAGKRMGHAGAIISGGKGTAQEKLAVMEACRIKVTRNPAEMGRLLQSVL